MVHALHEAHRVLKSNGILIDLRPALKHRHAGLGEGAGFRPLGVMREDFADDRAANRAVTQVLREGLFRRESRIEFDLDRVMDSLEDFREWLDEFGSLGKLPSHEWLFKRLERAVTKLGGQHKITVRGPLLLGVLRKT
jgi:SAM-dependent methyltransferase